MNKRMSQFAVVAIGFAAALGLVRTAHTAGKPAAEIKIVSDDIGGVSPARRDRKQAFG